MRGVATLFSVIVLLASCSVSYATIRSINASDLDSGFLASGGDYGIGILTVVDSANIVVEDTLGLQSTYAGGTLMMTTSLQSDLSVGGITSGHFEGGNLSILDIGGQALLTGDVDHLELLEMFDGSGILVGTGQFDVTGGFLETDFGQTTGDIVQISFQIVPSTISDFSADFSGRTDITLIPEPSMVCLLGLGALGLLCRKRKV